VCCHSNETRAPNADQPNNAQLDGTPYHSSNLHPGPYSSVGMRRGADRQTDTQTHRRPWPIYISPRLCLTRNVTREFIYLFYQNYEHPRSYVRNCTPNDSCAISKRDRSPGVTGTLYHFVIIGVPLIFWRMADRADLVQFLFFYLFQNKWQRATCATNMSRIQHNQAC